MQITILLLVITVALFAGTAFGQAEKLPDDSTLLLKKLAEWEVEVQNELKAEIEEKRKSVVTVLEQHMEEATKRGDLDVAIAIRKEIEELKEGISDDVFEGFSENLDEKWFIGTRWKVVRESLDTYEVVILKQKVKASTDTRFFDYKVTPAGSLTYQGLFRRITLRFSNDKKSGTYRDVKGTKGTIELITE